MRKAALAALLLVLVPIQARALDTEELLGLVAMPLAVAAASEVTGVPVGELSHLVATLNRAQVPPTQFVQVVRYAPAALVVEDQQPAFIEYIDSQVDRGITGSQLVTVIEERYETYDLDPRFVTLEEPATTYVVREDYIPELVVTRVAQVGPAYVAGDMNDLLALAAMPLAVAAVADLTGMPLGDLSSLMASLNAARVPPLQVVEVLRYSPMVLVDDTLRPQFVQFVDAQVDGGVTGLRLVEVIDDRLRTYDIAPRFGAIAAADVVEVVDDGAFFPAAVTSRVAEVRRHPHGGPPGQLKKDLGLQTGAEVVHGTRPRQTAVRTTDVDGRDEPARRIAKRRPRSDDGDRVVRERRATRSKERVERPRADRPRVERPRVEQPKRERGNRGRGGGGAAVAPPGASQASGGGQGQGKGQGQSQGKGKGKGKG